MPVEPEAFQGIDQLCRRCLVIEMKLKQQLRIGGAGVQDRRQILVLEA
ncbi:hypothetical protein QNM99_14220 [Pseudomonas sp. PCH446]